MRIDVTGLERALRAAAGGKVRFDPGSLAMYANDSPDFPLLPVLAGGAAATAWAWQAGQASGGRR